ncbi:MAG: hypothetical protein U0X91_27145 [Spirosomataceae bacterium]
MKPLTVLCLFLLAFVGVSCDRTNNGTTPTPGQTVSILTTNPWKVEKITDLNGNTINKELLPLSAQAFFGANIQFYEDKTVKAIDPVARQVLNGGSWSLLENEKILDIDIKDFKGTYPINKLERSRMSLRHSTVFNGLTFDVYLELVPAL